MAHSVKQLASSDFFFYYDDISAQDISEHDMMELILQPKRGLFYFRKFGAGVSDYENFPNAIFIQVLLRYSIADSIAYRNKFVTDGFGNTIDRRIAASQTTIGFKQEGGNLDIEVLYFLYSNFSNPNSLNVPFGVGV